MKFRKTNEVVVMRCNKSLDIWADKVKKTGSADCKGLSENVRRDVEALSFGIDIREWNKIAIDYHTPKQILRLASYSCCGHFMLRYKVVEQTSKRKVYSFYCKGCNKGLARKVVFPYKVGDKNA